VRHSLSIILANALVVLASLVSPPPGRASATFTIVSLDGPGEGFNDPTPVSPVGGNSGTSIGQQRHNAFQHAANIWGGLITSPVVIRVDAKFDPLSCSTNSAVLGFAGPKTVHGNFAGAPVSNTLYVQAQANSLFGGDLNPSQNDISATFSSTIGTPGCLQSSGWYYGLDGNPPAGNIDFVSVLLHELGHGLGFLTLVDLSTGAKFSGLDDAFMLHLEDHTTGKVYPQMTNAQRVAASMDTGNLHWVGANVEAASGVLTAGRVGTHVRMFTPNPQQPGSSVSHWDTALSPNEVMEPNYTGPLHDVGLALELFVDLGWNVGPVVAPLVLAPLLLTRGQVEVNYDAPLVTGGLGPYSFSFPKGGAFPPGLSGDTTDGHLKGTPTTKKSAKFTVQITDAQSSTVTGTFKLKILGALNVTTTSLKAGTHDKTYKARLRAKGGLKPFAWALAAASGPLPTGLGLDPLTGVISGTTAQIGAFNITVQVTDPMGGIDQQDLSLTIK
jgi:hypothetical protein